MIMSRREFLFGSLAVILACALIVQPGVSAVAQTDNFSSYRASLTSPGESGAAITPNDSADLAAVSRGLYVGTGGNVAMRLKGDAAEVTYHNLKAGGVYPFRVKRVMATGTTATNLRALY